MMIRMDELPDLEEIRRTATELAQRQQQGATRIIRLAAEMKALPANTPAREEAHAELHRAIDQLAQDIPHSSEHLVSYSIANAAVDVIGVLARLIHRDAATFLRDVENRTAPPG